MKVNLLLLLIIAVMGFTGCNPSTKTEQKNTSTSTPVEQGTPSCQLKLGYDAWEPYQYTDVGGKVSGLDIELINLITQNIGCELSYQEGTWVELLEQVKKGEVDMLVGASKTESREEYALFSQAYRIEQYSLYVRRSDELRTQYTSLDDFIQSNSRIGIVEDYYYGAQIAMLLEGTVTSKLFVNAIMGELNVARLLDNNIDVFVEDSFVGASMLRRKSLANRIVTLPISIESGEVYVMFSKATVNQQQVEQFNQQLNLLKNTGKYQALVEKYSL